MSTYQIYDFLKDINFHIKNNTEINLEIKSDIFRKFLFNLRIFQLNKKLKKSHPIFREEYFLFILENNLYVAKKTANSPLQFEYVEIVDGIKTIRKMKLIKLSLL